MHIGRLPLLSVPPSRRPDGILCDFHNCGFGLIIKPVCVPPSLPALPAFELSFHACGTVWMATVSPLLSFLFLQQSQPHRHQLSMPA